MDYQQSKTTSSSDTIRALLSSLVCIARGAGLIIRHIHASKTLDAKFKPDGSDVTAADLMSQRYITQQLSKHFPNLKWIGMQRALFPGEEDTEEMQKVELPELPYPEINKDLFKTLNRGEQQIDYEKTVIYIDPLDGTAQYKAGRIESVSVLIGVSVARFPKYGVVESVQDQDFKMPVSRFGGKGLGVFRYSDQGLTRLEKYKPMKKVPFRIITSESMGPEKCEKLRVQLGCEVESRLATGTRIVYLIEHPERCQAYLQKRGPQAQDECAPFALALQQGVTIHNFEGEQVSMSDPYNGKRFVAYWEIVGDSIREKLKEIEALF